MNKKAFTLIELLVVISIIALLLAILIPALSKVKDTARLVICSSNQRQLLLGVNAYASSNDGWYPPSIVATGWPTVSHSWPNEINYHCDRPVTAANHGGAVYYYLGSYLPDVGVYMCPLAPPGPEDLQDQYENYQKYGDWTTHSSYNLFWGGYQFNSSDEFKGPQKQSSKSSRLMVSDVLSFWGTQDIWFVAHRDKLAAKPDNSVVANSDLSVLWFRYADSSAKPQRVKYNAGYVDGSVSRFTSEQTDRMVQQGFPHIFYIPADWK